MSETLTPMMQQYQSIRRSLPADTLLLFRLGDFYEMFFEDAKEASAILNVALTKRNLTPMCGIPHHAADNYIRRLIKAGRRVAICDQIGEPQKGQIVQREITHIVSPGTVADLHMLDAKRNNFLAAIYAGGKSGYGFAFVDLTTGDFRLTELADEKELADELARVQPAEVLVSEEQAAQFRDVRGLVARDGYTFLLDQAYFTLRDHFKVQSLDGFGCEELPGAIGAAGAILHYLKTELRRSLSHITRLVCYRNSQFMVLDAATQANLELVEARGGGRDTSLLGALDRTVTPMGARKLRDWILHPLCEIAPLQQRQQMIADLLAEPFLLGNLRETLKSIRDMERTVGRLTQTGGNARDLQVLRMSLEQIPQLRDDLEALGKARNPLEEVGRAGAPRQARGLEPVETAHLSGLGEQIRGDLHPLPHVVELLTKAIVDEPPALTREGGMFRDGYFAPLDELRNAGREGKDWIAQLQQRAIEETGIKSLKVRYTSVFGYFIEVTKSNLHLVPQSWHRKQTVATGERFITPELKEVEGKILGADERAKALEQELFLQIRDEVLRELHALQSTAAAVATLDVLGAFGETARLFGYCRPSLSEDLRINIVDGRHPVLDQSLVEEKFVPNDVLLDGEKNRLLILTGPNMAGKSTYIRQVALLTLMAQIGSWVPAKEAEIGLADRIFTRVGASDDLSRGQSTFMVEMNETANITNNATVRSLVILDEIGRGTSTFDGLSIAWSVAEYLHDEVKARTLFATHYHELTELELTRTGVRNYNIAVREWNDQIIFLRKIIKGGADKSYGIQVARLAGLPAGIIARAKEILSNLEQHELTADGKPALAEAPPPPKHGMPRNKKKAEQARAEMKPQMTLF
ncbi:DNA mismatch repair protein MutS [Chthoniobacter flavus Ellin428]|uniref:DNA mismatch repair protein MutS n=1 Tax=Chthoniobacter flavus Ellin428 TaxID=497964 RepID=B4D9S2_9BACT|nr:DNA mismatch repair protein MutS [Chthoniobacter flavus]EDY16853.1 DNA mismatch repair protein MutS [Chthoniobacter flavus Ellin428]TCO93324.1 DNA mismatch repair protein MutS [Chthoniobacter flavus]